MPCGLGTEEGLPVRLQFDTGLGIARPFVEGTVYDDLVLLEDGLAGECQLVYGEVEVAGSGKVGVDVGGQQLPVALLQRHPHVLRHHDGVLVFRPFRVPQVSRCPRDVFGVLAVEELRPHSLRLVADREGEQAVVAVLVAEQELKILRVLRAHPLVALMLETAPVLRRINDPCILRVARLAGGDGLRHRLQDAFRPVVHRLHALVVQIVFLYVISQIVKDLEIIGMDATHEFPGGGVQLLLLLFLRQDRSFRTLLGGGRIVVRTAADGCECQCNA